MSDSQRLDKWLWHARFFRTRTLAARLCESGRVRVNRQPVGKPSTTVRVGDLLTFPQRGAIRVVRVLAMAPRRGSAGEASALYAETPPTPAAPRDAPGPVSSGRPDRRDRRALERLRNRQD